MVIECVKGTKCRYINAVAACGCSFISSNLEEVRKLIIGVSSELRYTFSAMQHVGYTFPPFVNWNNIDSVRYLHS